MRIEALVGSVTLSMALVAVPAWGEELVDATNPERILEIAKGFGSASLQKDSQGDPQIIGRIEGNKYALFFYGCSAGKDCDDIQFSAGWTDVKPSLKKVNAWNAKHRFGRVYIDDVGDAMIDMSINIDYGVTVANLEDTFNWWSRVMEEFEEYVVDNPELEQ